MSEVIKPDYVHFSRTKTITADEAQWLLASFELRDKNITNSEEYTKYIKKEMSLALKVLFDAFNHNVFKYDYIDYPYDIDPDGTKCWFFCNLILKTADFCTWAHEQNYKLPDAMAKLVKIPDNEKTQKNPGVEDSQKAAETPETEESQKTKCPGKNTVEPSETKSADNFELNPCKTSSKPCSTN